MASHKWLEAEKYEAEKKDASGGEVSHLESGFANAPTPRSSVCSHSLTGCARK
ncbi:hypothetical protein DSLASN_36970 [Desulfoluna limicola]|uniref:Uncharacterized protein n=1 Tax=Desulfoluna limicola TaxID=2810562 RepID=A0ABM7PLR6_9BACT|nr:hypothetical protein DSLASN_36970 [Desulfoluna limicola]